MLFSDEQIVSLLDGRFECSWESVHAVPRCEIDFGDGRKLTRTLSGNVATYLGTSEGEVFDIVTGVTTREDFLARLALALRFHETLASLEPAARKGSVQRYHEAMKDREKTDPRELARLAEGIRRQPDLSKRMIEQPIKDAIHGAADLIAERARAAAPRPIADGTKMRVELPIKNVLHEDTAWNRDERAPKVHALLARRPLDSPRALTKTVYKEILDVDLDDPYLGLAPYVLGGEPGRHEP